jgi:membrane fusion protein, multidrug efflux system
MKAIRILFGLAILGALATGAWILAVHPDWVKGAKEEDEDAAGAVAEVPVKLGKVTRATLRRYVDGYGTVEAQPAEKGKPAAGARVASPVAGVIAEVFCIQGQRVEKGAQLFQLDERSARAEEEKAAAAVGSARASLDKLKSIPRPDQVRVAEMQVDRARQAVEYSRKKQARLAQLAAEQLAAEKTLQEAELELSGARNDLAIAEKQLVLLRSTPTAEEVAEAQGKVVEAEKALAGAQVQRSLLKIQAPLSGTVVRVRVNPGEAVDLTTVLAELVDLDRLVVEGLVPASDLRSVAVGMDVDIRAGTDDAKVKPAEPAPAGDSPEKPAGSWGKVVFVGLDVDRKNDSGFVRVALPAKAAMPPGQFVRLRIVVEEHKNHLVVPRESVVRNEEGHPVIVGLLGEKAVQKEVRVGIREGALVEIEGDEIQEGDAVVTQGAYGLPGEAKIRVEGRK